ncbi:MAG: hypothetical protein IJ496_02480 [Ruminococcus sp.]|nr:hypothetical protein [Ruminococcus sp.]
MKKAFVMMPYAKDYDRVYSMIIKRALEEKGYECIRQDMTGQGGHVMKNVIQNIAESELVIADLSGLNWNVAYELGIRHTMNRNGTIIMCEREQGAEPSTKLPFDIYGMNILYYDKNWMQSYSEDKIVEELKKRVTVCENSTASTSDSPVHDVYTELPDSLLHIRESDQDNKQAERIKQLQEENVKLKDRIEKAGLDADESGQTEDIRKIFAEAIENSVYYSDEAVKKLQEFALKGQKKEFADFLADVLEKGYLDETDCKIVYALCREKIGIPPLTKVFLECAIKLHPDSEELNVYFADELGRDYKTREQAFVIANEMIGVSRKNGKYELTKHVSSRVIRAFFDVYIKLKKFNEIIQLSETLLEEYSQREMHALIHRNVANAYLNLDKLEEAEKACRVSLEYAPNDDMTYRVLYRIHCAAENYAQAYIEAENSINCDPTNENNYYIMAGFICDENYARTSAEDEPHLIDSRVKREYAVPFIIYALDMKKENYGRALEFLNRNGFEKEVQRCIEALQSGEDLFEAFSDLDFSMVEYCIEKEL